MHSSKSDKADKYSITSTGSGGPGSSKAAGHVSTVTRRVESSQGSSNGRGCTTPNPIRRQASQENAYALDGNDRYYTCHVRQCQAIKRAMGKNLWPPLAASIGGRRHIYASKDMSDADWEGCCCGLYIQSRFSLSESTLSPAGAKKYDVSDLLWVNSDLKPLRTWTKGGMSRKRKMFKSDGTGKFRDVSLSPVSDLECACDITRRTGLLHLCSSSTRDSRISNNNLYNLVSKANNEPKRVRLDLTADNVNRPYSANSVSNVMEKRETSEGRQTASVRPRSSSGNISTSGSSPGACMKKQKTGFGPTLTVGPGKSAVKKRSRLSGAARRKRAAANSRSQERAKPAPSAPQLSGARLHPQTIHMGNRSVTGQGATTFELDFNENKAAQNIIGYIGKNLPAWGPNIDTNPETAE